MTLGLTLYVRAEDVLVRLRQKPLVKALLLSIRNGATMLMNKVRYCVCVCVCGSRSLSIEERRGWHRILRWVRSLREPLQVMPGSCELFLLCSALLGLSFLRYSYYCSQQLARGWQPRRARTPDVLVRNVLLAN